MEALEGRGVASRVGFSQGRLRRRREVRADGVDVPGHGAKVARKIGEPCDELFDRLKATVDAAPGNLGVYQMHDGRIKFLARLAEARRTGRWRGRAQAGHGDDRVARVRAGDARARRVRQVASDGPDLPMGARHAAAAIKAAASPPRSQGVLQLAWSR